MKYSALLFQIHLEDGIGFLNTTLGKGLDSYGVNIHLFIQIIIVGKFL